MAALEWNKSGKKFWETGIDNVVLYVKKANPGEDDPIYENGVAWDGVTAVSESPSGAESNKLYAENGVYLNLISDEEFGCSITAYNYPDEFEVCDGVMSDADAVGLKIGAQPRRGFGLCYRTRVGNDVDGDSHAYKLHFVYNCMAAPSEKGYNTVNESPEAIEFSWEISTTKENMTGYRPVAHLEVDSRNFTTTTEKALLTALETYIWGGTTAQPQLPSPDKLKELLTPTSPDPEGDN